MASFGTLSLLLAFGLLAGPAGLYGFDAIRESHPPAAITTLVLMLALVGTGSRPNSSRCMSGFRSPIRRRRAMSRR